MIIIALAVFGVIFGSFVNALVWRLHEGEELRAQLVELRAKKKRPDKKIEALSAQLKAISIMKGRSMCPHCSHELAAKDLVPVGSWLWLRGKCRYCHKPIAWQYPAVELLTGLLFVMARLSWPLSFHGVYLFQFIVFLLFLVFFVALAVYDLRWFLLPDRIVLPLSAMAAVETVVSAIWLHSWSALWEPAIGAVIIFGLFWTLYEVSKGNWIGGGDVKLAIVLGLLAGTPLKAFLVIFFASLLGTVGSLPALFRGSQGLKVRIPFGPYLLLATVLAVLYGTPIVDWYQRLFSM